MASYESLTFYCSSQEEDDFDDADSGADADEGYDQNEHPHPQNSSELSVSSSSTLCCCDENALSMYLPSLSIESFEREGDGADEEFADVKELRVRLPSDSETELGGCYSLPAAKYYGNDGEGRKKGREKMRNRKKEKEEEEVNKLGKGLMVITRPRGGRRSLCMDIGEVKACQELGFDLEHERMLQLPPRLSLSSSTLDSTSSGGNSPISNWRISSPGDDPRDVKARLKLWAQAVAVASTSKHSN